tara:strand:+ start:19765 stop:20919 length:1155 start_codon:yes stop_codon:yes gene_type:complete
MKKKIIRITTVPMSLGGLLTGQLKYMSDYYEIIGVASDGDGTLANIGIQEGIKVFPIEMTRSITPFRDLRAIWQLYIFLKREKPFIVHSHTPKAGTVGMIAAFLAGVPHRLHTIAGLPLLEAQGGKRKVLDIVEKITYAFATRIYPNSFGMMDIILENKFTNKNKLKVLGNGSSNGIDIDHFNPSTISETEKENLRKSLGIDPNDFVYVFVGRMVTDKGVNELVHTFSRLTESIKSIKLILVGPHEKSLDPLSEDTETLIASNPAIKEVGLQKDVRPFFAIADVLTFPSYREGFPNVVLQAGAMGIPAIVSDINGCNEIVQEGVNGNIVPAKDEKSLYSSMLQNYLKKQEGTTFDSNLIRNLIKEKYQRTAIWEAILNEYNSFK